MAKRAAVFAAAVALLMLAFIAGIESQSHRLLPARGWAKIKAHLKAPLPPAITERHPLPCPANAMVILVIGQSHGANSVADRFSGRPGVFNAFHAKCYAARDPLLGTEGDKGNLWTEIGNQLVGARLAPAVVIATTAMGSSKIAQWIPGGSLNPYLRENIAALPSGMTITHVALQIGEGDYEEGTTAKQFRQRLGELIGFLRSQGVSAPVYLARESLYCSSARASNPIAKVQRTFQAEGVFPGPNMDALPFGRSDGCHLSGAGAKEFAAQWVEVLAPGTYQPD